MNHLLKNSLNAGIPVQIIYQSKDNAFSKRKIIVKSMNERYIKAFCLTKQQVRIFRIDAILAVGQIRKSEERYYA